MADFYGDAAGFKAYWAARGVDKSALDDSVVETALLVASEFIDAAFWDQWQGLKSTGNGRDQIRDWPRAGVIDRNGYAVDYTVPPREVINATYEAASRQLATPGVFYKDFTPNQFTSVSVTGAISVDYAVGDAYSFQTQMPALGAVLAPILGCGAGGSRLSGGTGR